MNSINDTLQKADPLDEAALRHAVLGALRAEHGKNANSLIIEELGLRHGSARIDIAVIGMSIHGVELKSNKDTLERLTDQAAVYNAALEEVTLVVGDSLLGSATDVIPKWWGLKLAFHAPGGEVCLVDVRNAGRNPGLDKVAVAELLWREEALALLEDLEEDKGLRSKPRHELYEHLACVLDLGRLLLPVTEVVRGRTDGDLVNDKCHVVVDACANPCFRASGILSKRGNLVDVSISVAEFRSAVFGSLS